jgi:16S rRNA (adenine1518-N6/adenine1519-N6)-dimethyltransferase
VVRAKKRFGQHFLIDKSYISKIVEAMPAAKYRLVEIGSGLGDLTEEILTKRDLIAIEVDRDLIASLEARFVGEIASKRLKLICADALLLWQEGGLSEVAYDLVGNLPYYIATEIILRALADPHCKSLTVMTQVEVARKWTAEKGSALSLLARSVGEAQFCFEVPPEAFEPKPKVFSAVLRIVKSAECFDLEFSRFLRGAFAQPRKTLLGNLRRRYEKTAIEDAFRHCQIAPAARAHELTLEQFMRLKNML